VWRIRGDGAQAEPLIRESMEIARRAGWGISGGALLAPRVEMARVWALAGRYAEAEVELRECLAEYRRQMSDNGGEVAYTLTALGQTLNMAGEPERAEQPLREALAARRRVLPPGDRRTAETAGELGASLLGQGKREEARPLLEASYEELLRAYGPQHPYTGRAKRRIESLRGSFQPSAFSVQPPALGRAGDADR
jgi:tetratricopeptide (TPR) repeat protein